MAFLMHNIIETGNGSSLTGDVLTIMHNVDVMQLVQASLELDRPQTMHSHIIEIVGVVCMGTIVRLSSS